jgi:anti-anti-sigma regulatory factor
MLYGIELRGDGQARTLVSMRGEFDVAALEELRGVMDGVCGLRRPAAVDLSEVTFLDLGCARELAVRSQLYAHQLSLLNPSWEVLATVRAFGLEGWVRLGAAEGERSLFSA